MARKLVLAGIAGVAVLASGCSGSTVIGSDGPQPGVAATVDDASLTIDDADATTDAFCAVQENNPQAQAITRALAQQTVVAQWVTTQAARDLVAEKGIDIQVQPFDYGQIPGWDDLSQGQQDVLTDYVDDLNFLNEASKKLPHDKSGLNVSGIDISVNPRYDITVKDDRLADATNDLSAAISDESVAVSAEQPTAEQLASLPDSQICGTKPQPSAAPSQPPIPVPQG